MPNNDIVNQSAYLLHQKGNVNNGEIELMSILQKEVFPLMKCSQSVDI